MRRTKDARRCLCLARSKKKAPRCDRNAPRSEIFAPRDYLFHARSMIFQAQAFARDAKRRAHQPRLSSWPLCALRPGRALRARQRAFVRFVRCVRAARFVRASTRIVWPSLVACKQAVAPPLSADALSASRMSHHVAASARGKRGVARSFRLGARSGRRRACHVCAQAHI